MNRLNILIIDDEKLTREGIIASIDWKRLNIHGIYEADDGVNGLKQAKLYRPEIILSDVRMPRMNGIDMCKELQTIVPNSSIIFMSGYSDKEYLKAAITLKAISYVEKPINTVEIEEAIRSAIELQRLHVKNQATITTHNKFMQDKLSLDIIYTPLKKSVSDYIKQFQELGFPLKSNSEFTTLIITLKTAISSLSEHAHNSLNLAIDDIVKKFRVNYIYGIKNDEYIILHLFTNGRPIEANLKGICNDISQYLKSNYRYYIALGKTVTGIQNVYQSYNTAVLLMQSSFFYDYNSVIKTQDVITAPISDDNALYLKFEEGLRFNDQEKIVETVNSLYNSMKNNQVMLPNHAKDTYYKLFGLLREIASNQHISPFYEESSSAILDYVSKCGSLSDLNRMLLDKIDLYFHSVQKENIEHTTIFAIKEFISKNYGNENLSVKDISDSVFLSSTYVCTLFKNETGKTLNQFLTEYRIEKAKSMLKDFRIKITDISSKVGYSDGNYFSKAFKKLVGLSPSEYRERYGKS